LETDRKFGFIKDLISRYEAAGQYLPRGERTGSNLPVRKHRWYFKVGGGAIRTSRSQPQDNGMKGGNLRPVREDLRATQHKRTKIAELSAANFVKGKVNTSHVPKTQNTKKRDALLDTFAQRIAHKGWGGGGGGGWKHRQAPVSCQVACHFLQEFPCKKKES